MNYTAYHPTPGAEPVPGYRLVALLGRGGFGEVWKADAAGGFQVALKLVPLEEKAGAVELRALDIIRNLRHPNLVHTFGAWQEHGCLIVAMELADRTLLDRLREVHAQGQPGIPSDELLEYLREAAKGIDYLNELHAARDGRPAERVVHRDIKPQNILLVGGGVKIADFGLARVAERSRTSGPSAQAGGLTPTYAAPEFFRNETAGTSDQYSLAVTYCQLRGGRPPFDGGLLEVMAGHLTRPPELDMLPAEERPVVARALDKKPDARWPSCRAFVEALHAAAGTGTVKPAAPPPAATPTRDLPGAAWADTSGHGPPLLGSRTAPGEMPASRPSAADAGDREPRRPRLPVIAMVAILILLVGSGATWLLINALAEHTTPGTAGPPRPPGTPAQPPVQPVVPMPEAGAIVVHRGDRRQLVAPFGQIAFGPKSVRVEGASAGIGVFTGPVSGFSTDVAVDVAIADDTPFGPASFKVLVTRPGRGEPLGERTLKLSVQPHPLGAPPRLRLVPPTDTAVIAGMRRSFHLAVERSGLPGPVEVKFSDLPPGLRLAPVLVAADRVSAEADLQSDEGVEPGLRQIKVVASCGNIRDEATLQIRLNPPYQVTFVGEKEVKLKPGESKVHTFTLTAGGPPRSPVFIVEGVPAGLTFKYREPLRPTPRECIFDIAAAKDAPKGEHDIIIRAGGGYKGEVKLRVVVLPE